MAESRNLMFRGETRHEVALGVRLRVASTHRPLVRVLGADTADAGVVDGLLMDISATGLGVMTSGFLPRMARVDVELDLSAAGWPAGDDDAEPEAVAAPARVVRVAMTDRRPAYLLGMVFDADRMDPQTQDVIQRLLDRLEAGEAA